jgi:coenzyme F420 hydrogenase subunit beta
MGQSPNSIRLFEERKTPFYSEERAAVSLNDTVIDNGYCIGCGLCAAVPGSPYSVELNELGLYEARAITDVSAEAEGEASRVCPFSDSAKDEDELSRLLFGKETKRARYVGSYIGCYAGYVTDESIRMTGSSGALGRWLTNRLLQEQMIDGVVHVVSSNNDEGKPYFQYAIDDSRVPWDRPATSAYYPVTLKSVLTELYKKKGRYLVVGVPCFIKGIRLRCLEDQSLAHRIGFTLGVICGHMKSAAFAQLVGWQQGIPPHKLTGINFRGKTAGRSASTKRFIAYSHEGSSDSLAGKLYGTSYSMGMFKPKACDFCDDVLAETADISIGDAWLPRYVKDYRGTSIVVVRNKTLDDVLERGVTSGELRLNALRPSKVVESQASGIRHRNEGLEYRLWWLGKSEKWMPRKRIRPSVISRFKGRKGLYELRFEIARRSHAAFLRAKAAKDLDSFYAEMDDLVARHKAYNRRRKAVRRAVRSVARRISKMLKR